MKYPGGVQVFDGSASPSQRCVLAVGAHPDDVVLSVGGLLAQLSAAGHRVVVLTLSSGELGGDPDIRELEETEAAERIGASAEFGRLPDGDISIRSAISVIEKAIAKHSPTLGLIHSLEDSHQDHVAAYRAGTVAFRHVPTLLSYESPSSLCFHPTITLNVSDVWKQKLHALAAFESQLLNRKLLRWVDAVGRYRAWPRHADAFCEGLRTCHSQSLPALAVNARRSPYGAESPAFWEPAMPWPAE